MEAPKLTDYSTKYYLYNVLKKCHDHRVSIYYYVLNISVFVVFLGVTAAILYSCHKNKLTDHEKQVKMMRDQQYILSKIRYYKEDKKRDEETQYSGITDLPFTAT
jgi:hypothetical protein